MALFLASLVAVYLVLVLLLPAVDPKDRDGLRLPRNVDDLRELNCVLQIYKEHHYARVMGCFIAVYLLQVKERWLLCRKVTCRVGALADLVRLSCRAASTLR